MKASLLACGGGPALELRRPDAVPEWRDVLLTAALLWMASMGLLLLIATAKLSACQVSAVWGGACSAIHSTGLSEGAKIMTLDDARLGSVPHVSVEGILWLSGTGLWEWGLCTAATQRAGGRMGRQHSHDGSAGADVADGRS